MDKCEKLKLHSDIAGIKKSEVIEEVIINNPDLWYFN